MLATYGMARGWVEFWLVWIARRRRRRDDAVDAGYYPTAGMYVFYGGFVVVGFIVWRRVPRRSSRSTAETHEGAA